MHGKESLALQQSRRGARLKPLLGSASLARREGHADGRPRASWRSHNLPSRGFSRAGAASRDRRFFAALE
jgi:hypothetical protein